MDVRARVPGILLKRNYCEGSQVQAVLEGFLPPEEIRHVHGSSCDGL